VAIGMETLNGDPTLATLYELVERANSNHSFTVGFAHSVGLRCVYFPLFHSNSLIN